MLSPGSISFIADVDYAMALGEGEWLAFAAFVHSAVDLR